MGAISWRIPCYVPMECRASLIAAMILLTKLNTRRRKPCLLIVMLSWQECIYLMTGSSWNKGETKMWKLLTCRVNSLNRVVVTSHAEPPTTIVCTCCLGHELRKKARIRSASDVMGTGLCRECVKTWLIATSVFPALYRAIWDSVLMLLPSLELLLYHNTLTYLSIHEEVTVIWQPGWWACTRESCICRRLRI